MRRRLATIGGLAIPAPAGLVALWLASSSADCLPAFLVAAILNVILLLPWLLVQLEQALPATIHALDSRLALLFGRGDDPRHAGV
jgi:hypothetical protein